MDSYQDTLFKLKKFWASRGCVIQEPYDVEVGAGTMCPETFLRVLGPKPYRVAYVQPSRRPADGRYGENPNRLYKHSQLQVILKPAPANVMDLYLESLEATLQRMRYHRHEVVLFQILHHDELAFEFDGMVKFIGLELPEELITQPEELRRAYLRAFGQFSDQFEEL